MAERPSVKDILAKARAAAAQGPPAEVPAVPAAEPEVVAAAEVVEAAPAAAAAPTAASLGRPLTLKEKLAASRAGAAPPVPAAAPKTAPSAAPIQAVAAAAAPAAEAPSVPAPAAPIGRPLTLKEKLAASRAGSTVPAAAAPGAAKPAAAKPTAAAAKPDAAARTLPPLETATDPRDIAEHLRRAGADKDKTAKADAAAKIATAAGATPATAKAASAKKLESKVVPPKPSKETATGTGSAPVIGRRPLLGATGWIVLGWSAFGAGLGTLGGACLRFMYPNVLAEPPSTIKVGLASNFEPGQVNERWKAEWGFWIVRSAAYDGEDKIYAIQSVCTHLGCPPNWLVSEQKFKCPCHGSGFYVSGVNFEGPAPRPLERFKVSVNDAGEIVVDKSQKFQEELKQWTDPDSFIIA